MANRHEQLEKMFNLPSLSDLDEDEIEDVSDEVDDESFEFEEDDEGPSYDDLQDRVSKLSKEIKKYEGMNDISGDIAKKYNDHVDELHDLAKNGYEEVFSAALTLEPAHGAKFLSGAAKLLEIALRSKNSSMDKQIEMAKLQLQREKLMKENRGYNQVDISDDDELPEGGTQGDNGGVLYSRNDLIKQRQRDQNKFDDGDDLP